MTHEQLNSLAIHVSCACYIVSLGYVGELFGQALPVKVFFRIGGLMLDDFVGHNDGLVAILFALRKSCC